jgi:hypothetical protein
MQCAPTFTILVTAPDCSIVATWLESGARQIGFWLLHKNSCISSHFGTLIQRILAVRVHIFGWARAIVDHLLASLVLAAPLSLSLDDGPLTGFAKWIVELGAVRSR